MGLFLWVVFLWSFTGLSVDFKPGGKHIELTLQEVDFMYKYYNPNPAGRVVGDCAVRAVSKALGITWEEAFDKLATAAYKMADLPNSDSVWGAVLRMNGFYRESLPNTCPDCYTARDSAGITQ